MLIIGKYNPDLTRLSIVEINYTIMLFILYYIHNNKVIFAELLQERVKT